MAEIPNALGPTPETERLGLLDALRGFALFGVLVSNLDTTSGEVIVLTAERAATLPTAAWDGASTTLIRFFINIKFIALFTTLFGVGFALQHQRASLRAPPATVTSRYLRRQGILFVFALCHVLFWWGDILHFYAILGLLLLPLQRLRDRTLLWLGGFLVVVPYTLLNSMGWWSRILSGGAEAAGGTVAVDAALERSARFDARLSIFTEGQPLAAVLRENFACYLEYYSPLRVGAMSLFILGFFVLGLVIGRLDLLRRPDALVGLAKRFIPWGLAVGIPGNLVLVMAYQFYAIPPDSPWIMPGQLLIWIGTAALAGVYASMIVLLWQHPVGASALGLLAPVGRMALTNYLTHSLFFLGLLYRFNLVGDVTVGLGLLRVLGSTGCLVLGVILFAVQMFFSHLWLRYHRFGPMEWLWRSLTYGERQPWRR